MMSEPSGADPAKIYLEPDCCVDPSVGRNWCKDDVWPVTGYCEKGGVEYIRADLALANQEPVK